MLFPLPDFPFHPHSSGSVLDFVSFGPPFPAAPGGVNCSCACVLAGPGDSSCPSTLRLPLLPHVVSLSRPGLALVPCTAVPTGAGRGGDAVHVCSRAECPVEGQMREALSSSSKIRVITPVSYSVLGMKSFHKVL